MTKKLRTYLILFPMVFGLIAAPAVFAQDDGGGGDGEGVANVEGPADSVGDQTVSFLDVVVGGGPLGVAPCLL